MASFFFWWLILGPSNFPALSLRDLMVILFLSPLLETENPQNRNHSILTFTLCARRKTPLGIMSVLFYSLFTLNLNHVMGGGIMLGQWQQRTSELAGKMLCSNASYVYSTKTYTGTFGSWADDEDRVIISALQ